MNNVTNQEQNEAIKRENRKALKIYIPILIASAIGGGILGFFTVTQGVQAFGEKVSGWLAEFLYLVSPYCMIVIEAASLAVGIYFYLSAKKMAQDCVSEEEEEELYERVDRKASCSMIAVNAGMILSFLFFGISFNVIERNVEERMALFVIVLAVFLLSLFGQLRLQQLLVDLTKQLNPKMKGSVYDLKFHEKWEDSCDEAEKLTIYKAGYKAFKALNTMCSVLWVVLLLGSMVFHYSALSVVILSFIWLVVTLVYCRESMRLEHGRINE